MEEAGDSGNDHSCFSCWCCGKCDMYTCPNGKATCDCGSTRCGSCSKCTVHWAFTGGYCNYHAGGTNNGGWLGDEY